MWGNFEDTGGTPPVLLCINIQFFPRTVSNTIEIFHKFTGQFGDQRLLRTRAFASHKKFDEGRTRVENQKHYRRPQSNFTSEDIRAIQDIIGKERWIAKVSGPHTVAETVLKLNEIHWTTLDNRPYSQDLMSCDFHLVVILKGILRFGPFFTYVLIYVYCIRKVSIHSKCLPLASRACY